MLVLIVEDRPGLGRLWQAHLVRLGLEASLVGDVEGALTVLRDTCPEVIVADLDLPGAGALAVADYAGYRHPQARVVFVTGSSFFSDGSIFAASANACAFLPARMAPEDLAAVVEFQARRNVAGA